MEAADATLIAGPNQGTRNAVHAAIGAIQPTLFFRSTFPPERLAELLEGMAHGCLGTTPVPFGSEVPVTSTGAGPQRG